MSEVARLTDSDIEKIDNNIADVLLGAAGYLDDESKKKTINIVRKGKALFSFMIEPIDEKTIERCRRQNTKNRGRRNEEFDGNRYVAQLIYESTCAEDKKRLWQNKEVWDKLNVANGADLILKVLTPAERAELENIMIDMLGFNEDLTEMVKNS